MNRADVKRLLGVGGYNDGMCTLKPFLAAVLLLILAACSPATAGSEQSQATGTPRPTRTGEFILYSTSTGTVTPNPENLTSPTPLPSPTPTPRVHLVALGEDMFGISLRYGVTLAELREMNPDIDPNLLVVGMKLLIPPTSVNPPNFTPEPTAVQLPVRPPDCAQTAEGGVWCFTLATNDLQEPVESVSAVFRLAGSGGGEIISQTASAALDLVPAGEWVPLLAYFPPPVPSPFSSSVDLQGALPAANVESRFLPIQVASLNVEISLDGQSAEVSVGIMSEDDRPVGLIRAAAVAYDAGGKIVGVRVFESSQADFVLTVYSVAGPIERVEIRAEARP